MSPKDALKLSIGMSDFIISSYLSDLSDSDILVRPVPGMNHIAWQLGHLISAEHRFVDMVKPGSCPALPAGFDEAHNKEAAKSDDPASVLAALEIPGTLEGTAGSDTGRARQHSRIRDGQDRPRQVSRVGSESWPRCWQ